MEDHRHTLIIVMGVSGCGKSTIGQHLASQLGAPFLDADDFHPASNIEKMAGGTPLTDEDRVDWIKAMNKGVLERSDSLIVLACSALTQRVQQGLAELPHRLVYIHLNTQAVDMVARLSARDHFMPASLLQSQLDALSPPEDALEFDVSLPVLTLVDCIQQSLSNLNHSTH